MMSVSHNDYISPKTMCSLLTAFTLLVLSKAAVCYDFNNSGFESDIKSFYGLDNGPLPTRMLDGDLLYLAADAERDASMSRQHKRANYLWLYNYRKNNYTGMGAIRKLLRMSLRNYLPESSSTTHTTTEAVPEQVTLKKRSQFTTMDNYRLDVSNNKVRLKFSYRF